MKLSLPRRPLRLFLWCGFVGLLSALHADPAAPKITGQWKLDLARSSTIRPWDNEVLTISEKGGQIILQRDLAWGPDRKASDTTTIVPDGKTSMASPLSYWLETWYTNVYVGADHQKHTIGEWLEAGRILKLETQISLEAQQGERLVHIYDEYRLSEDGRTLKLFELRSTRDEALVYIFTRV